MHNPDFTEGKITGPLLRFIFPIMFALFLQSLYGAVDLLIVGKFSDAANVSAVSTGSQLMQSVTIFFADLALGATVLLGMLQGIIGAFLIRAPLSYLFSILSGGSVFMISLATPCSSFVQIILCIVCFLKWRTED